MQLPTDGSNDLPERAFDQHDQPVKTHPPGTDDLLVHASVGPEDDRIHHGPDLASDPRTVGPTIRPGGWFSSDPLRALGFAVIGLGTAILFWKLHGFKLPSEIARERAQARIDKGQAGVRLAHTTIWTTITDVLTPWRWGRGDMLKNSTATGGDMGAHVWTPDVVKRSIITKGRLTGWSNDWFRGMPVLGFYFPLPTLLIVLLSVVLPYGIAFKLVTVLGIMTLPVCCWAAGRLAGMRRPIPVLTALAGMVFVLGRNYDLQIYGGNILSTMAGEFSFSISLSLAILFLGLFARVLRTGEKRGWAAVVLACTGLCHLLPTMWALAASFVMLLTHLDPKRLKLRNRNLFFGALGAAVGIGAIASVVVGAKGAVIIIGLALFSMAVIDQLKGTFGLTQLRDALLVLGCGAAIAGFWLVPFMTKLDYSNDMGWEKMRLYVANLFPFWAKKPPSDAGIIAIAMLFAVCGALGALASLARAMTVRAKANGGWSPLLFPVAIVVSALLGLVIGSINSNGLLGIGVLCAGVAFSFFMACAAAEVVAWRRWTLVAAVMLAAFVGLTQWGRHPLAIVLSCGLLISVVLVTSALSNLEYERWGLGLTIIVGIAVSLFTLSPQFRLWNARVLPFWFFTILLLAAYGAVAMMHGFAALLRLWGEPRRHSTTRGPIWGTAAATALVFVGAGLPLNLVPDGLPIPKVKKGLLGVQRASDSHDASPVTGWSGYNFKGYEGQAAWPEYRALMNEAIRVGKTNGCGTAMWEYEDSKLNSFGTTLSLMLFPFWTKGCIGSVEGVYFESSATAPMHWLNAALVTAPAENNADGSKKTSGPSNPQRDLPYPSYDLEKGIAKLRNAGVKYYVALTDKAKGDADKSLQLTKVGASGVFSFYQLRDYAIVAPLTEEPVVVQGIAQDQNGGWLDVEVDAYNAPDRYPASITAAGPKSWQRITASVKKPKNIRTYGVGVVSSTFQRRTLPTVNVSNITSNNTDITFDVDRVGVPVIVRESFFPNWKVSGAKGPYRVMPNFMVVIPTSKHVRVHYGYTGGDIAGHAATLAGLAGAFWLHRSRRTGIDDDEVEAANTYGEPGGDDRDERGSGDDDFPGDAGRRELESTFDDEQESESDESWTTDDEPVPATRV